jgi:hypothetical protein
MAILAQQFPTFQRAMRVIASISNSSPAVVTTTFNHQYITGLIVRLYIPIGFGMHQIDQQQGTITVTGDTTFTIDINTLYIEPFAAATTFPESQQFAQVVPVAEVNSSLLNATQNVLPYSAT